MRARGYAARVRAFDANGKKDRRELPKDKKRIITVKTGGYVKASVSVFSTLSRLKPHILTTKVSKNMLICYKKEYQERG